MPVQPDKMTDAELFALIRDRLFTAVIGDVMDKAGLTRQFLPPEIRPVDPGTVLVGRAMPVLVEDVATGNGASEAYGVMFKALDELKPGEIYLTAGGSPDYALWGGLMSTRAMRLGAAGAVFEGYHRDTREIMKLGFPVFSMGAYAQDQKDRGRAVDYRCRVSFGNGAAVPPGDVIVGDIDGVVVIPQEAVADITRDALAKVTGEEDVRRMIEGGEPTGTIFARTGIM
jgi:4-hydroxy-4-methyl-2-oxoglutarate aldolase